MTDVAGLVFILAAVVWMAHGAVRRDRHHAARIAAYGTTAQKARHH